VDVFWDVAPCNLVEVSLLLAAPIIKAVMEALKMEAANTFETSVNSLPDNTVHLRRQPSSQSPP
jgi:hypothetical protein